MADDFESIVTKTWKIVKNIVARREIAHRGHNVFKSRLLLLRQNASEGVKVFNDFYKRIVESRKLLSKLFWKLIYTDSMTIALEKR